jgi:hypothetical protein
MAKPSIFIGSSAAGVPLSRELAKQLKPISTTIAWSDGGFLPGLTPTQSLTEAAGQADFAIFILTAERPVGSKVGRVEVRDNLIFELGFWAGRLGMSRTIVLFEERALLPFNLSGILGIRLLSRSQSDLREVVAPAVAQIRRLVLDTGPRSDRIPEFYSCFLSYSWRDKDFAAKLHDDLEEVGVSCWLDAQEIKTGDNIQEQIGRAIQEQDKLLLVLSEDSIRSAWVQAEIATALELERARKKTVLFPIRLDDAVFSDKAGKNIYRIQNRLIVDFHDWQDQTKYQRAFSRLVRDLAIRASIESDGAS